MRATLLLILLHEVSLAFQPTSNWQIFAPDGRRKYLDAGERQRFIEAAAEEARPIQALCIYLIHCGCRVSEALALRTEHIELSTNRIVLLTMKRRKLVFRQVPLPEEAVEMLKAIAPSQGLIWPVHRATAWRWVTRVMARAQISGPMACCRGTRHSFAIHAALSNVPPNLIQRWMGHAAFQTTAIYLDAVGEGEREFAKRMWTKV